MPTLKQVREHFKNAGQVRSTNGFTFDYTRSTDLHKDGGHFYCTDEFGEYRSLVFFDQFATILSTNQPEVAQVPTLDELKQYYNDAVVVKEATEFTIDWDRVYLSEFNNWCIGETGGWVRNYLWSKGKYAEIVKYKSNTEQMDTRTITSSQAQSIINIACDAWSKKLADKWATDIVLQKDITISHDFYRQMRSACTPPQHELFDTIFGQESKFKVGDWVNWKGNNPITAQIIRRAVDVNGTCWVLNDKTHNSCHESRLELATGDDITRAKYKVGDWVYIGNETSTWSSVVQLTKVDGMAYAISKDRIEEHFSLCFIERLATQEEIEQATFIAKGTPCLVRDSEHSSWMLAYSTGDGTYEGRLSIRAWAHVQVLDMKNLPKY